MPNPWFRLYSEFATDPKVQMMSEADQRRFLMLLCMRCGNDNATLQDQEIVFQLRISPEEWQKSKAVFLEKKLIDEDNRPLAWDRRQFTSDSSTERSRACRERKKQPTKDAMETEIDDATNCNVAATPPDQTRTRPEPDTDTEPDNHLTVPVTARAGGSFKKIGFDGGLDGSWFEPDEETVQEIISNCRGWNVEFLVQKYHEHVRSLGEKPKYPQRAFVGWAKKFTKGKPPS